MKKTFQSISLVVPVFAHHNYVAEMLESIDRQKIKPDRVILIDDLFSQDVSALLTDFAKSRTFVKLIRNSVNLGVSLSTGLGISSVDTNFVGFLDSDDLLEPDAISRFKKALKKNPNLQIYTSNYQYILNTGDTWSKKKNEVQFRKPVDQTWQEMLVFDNFVSHFKVVKHEIFDQFQYTNSYDGVQDAILNYSCSPEVEIFFDQKCTYVHRIHNDQLTNKSNGKDRTLRELNRHRSTWLKKVFNRVHFQHLPAEKVNFRIAKKQLEYVKNQVTVFGVMENGQVDFECIHRLKENSKDYLYFGSTGANGESAIDKLQIIEILKFTSIPFVYFANESNLNFIKTFSAIFDFVVSDNESISASLNLFLSEKLKIVEI